MKEKKFTYILTEDEKKAVEYAIDYFFESVPYIDQGFMSREVDEKREFRTLVNDLAGLVQRMGDGAGE